MLKVSRVRIFGLVESVKVYLNELNIFSGQVDSNRAKTGVRGIVLDAKTRQPLGGVEVVAVRDQPSLAPLVDRFRGLFQSGMFVDTRAPRRETSPPSQPLPAKRDRRPETCSAPTRVNR